MEMKYKHKKTGDIAIMKSNNSSFYTYDGMDIHARIVENSNDWEEIIEKNYEILSILYETNNDIYTWDGHTFNNGLGSIGLSHVLQGCIGNPNTGCNIYINSVKRLSDGEIFTIGDKCKWQGNGVSDIGVISKIIFYNNTIYIENTQCSFHFSYINKLNPLFKTEDGKECFNGDFIYVVDEKYKYPTKIEVIEGYVHILNAYKTFSSKEEAENFILMNNPCLNIKDVENALIDGCDRNPSRTNGSKTLEILKQLVKSKL